MLLREPMPRRTVLVLSTTWARARRLRVPNLDHPGVALDPDTPTVLLALPLNSDLAPIRDWTLATLAAGRRVKLHAVFTFVEYPFRIERRFEGYRFAFASVHDAVLFKLRWFEGAVALEPEPHRQAGLDPAAPAAPASACAGLAAIITTVYMLGLC